MPDIREIQFDREEFVSYTRISKELAKDAKININEYLADWYEVTMRNRLLGKNIDKETRTYHVGRYPKNLWHHILSKMPYFKRYAQYDTQTLEAEHITRIIFPNVYTTEEMVRIYDYMHIE